MNPLILEVLEPYCISKINLIYSKTQPLMEQKKYNEVLEIINSAINLNQDDLKLLIFKIIILYYLNRNIEALELLNKKIDLSNVIKGDDIITSYYFILAFSNITLGDFKSALENGKKVLELFPNHPISYATKGLILGYNYIYRFNTKKIKEDYSFNNINKAIDLEPYSSNKARYYQLKSNILLELKKYKESLEAIDKAIDLNPEKQDFYHSKNRILLYLDRYNDVLMLLDKMLLIFPETEKDIKIKKASVLKKIKKIEEGFKIIEELLIKYPGDKDLLVNKAYWLEYLNRKEEALKIIQSLIDDEPNNGIYHDTYGEILMHFQDYENAIIKFQKAIDISSYDWYINQTYIKLGICYKELGNYELAVEILNNGKALTDKYFYDLDTKRKWLTIANLFLEEIELMRDILQNS